MAKLILLPLALVALVIGANNACTVDLNALIVQEKFNFTAFMGKWFETRWWDDSVHEDDTQAFDGMSFVFDEKTTNVSDPQALATLYAHKKEKDSKCMKLNAKGTAKLYDVDSTDPAKMRYYAKSDMDNTFWVISMKSDMALVVQCPKIETNGSCTPNVKVNVLSREAHENSAVGKEFDNIITQSLCVDTGKMAKTDLTRDCENELNGASKLCGISSIFMLIVAFLLTKINS